MFCICTAGHVNHGKTSLVKSLTGLDTDRLVEEKKRGKINNKYTCEKKTNQDKRWICSKNKIYSKVR